MIILTAINQRKCPFCGKEEAEFEAKFCIHCGTKMDQMTQCIECKYPYNAEENKKFSFCPGCSNNRNHPQA